MVSCKCKDDKCPNYFENQSAEIIPVIGNINIGEIIRLPVLIKKNDVKVKVDSCVEILTEAIGLNAISSFRFNYLLQRSTNNGIFKTLATIRPAQDLIFENPVNPPPFDSGALIPNLTWTDMQPGIGCHVYRIFFSDPSFISLINTTLSIRTRAINATVFCH
ncbi:hypothetical protein V1503_02980 [Bacillus sp. SCS-151]|uniref:hypothetical protein n=1 Tax=Nanhaiella sioensis TaxID=3115293 RepID=UPI00397AA944